MSGRSAPAHNAPWRGERWRRCGSSFVTPSTALPIDAAAVLAGRAELEALRDALLGEARCSCRGVAQASILLHDEHSPVYTAGAGVTVAVVAAAARAALSAGADALPGV